VRVGQRAHQLLRRPSSWPGTHSSLTAQPVLYRATYGCRACAADAGSAAGPCARSDGLRSNPRPPTPRCPVRPPVAERC
jgi:hypothetical protein